MLRMEIALFLVACFVAYIYFSAERKHSPLHRTFSGLLIAVLIHLLFDAATVYTVSHLDTVPVLLNDILHRFFIGTMVLIVYLSQLFKNEIGVNFLSYLTGIRMEKAKKLLLSSALSVAEVAEQSGYADYRVFTKVFKKAEGCTPSQLRRDFLEN